MPFSGLTTILNDVWDAITHALRVEPAAGSFPVSGTVTANQGTPNAGGAQSWPTNPLQDTDRFVAPVLFTANGTLTIDCQAGSSTTVYLKQGAAGWTGTALFEVSQDGTNFDQIPVAFFSVGTYNSTIAGTGAGNLVETGVAYTGGYKVFRVTITVTGGSVTCGLENSLGVARPPSGPPAISPPNVPLAGILARDAVANAWQAPNARRSLTIDAALNSGESIGQTFLFTVAVPYLYDGTQNNNNRLLIQRTPVVFKDAQATASGSTALWTPAAGKKFRLMRYCLVVTADAAQAVAGDLTIRLLDSATGIGQRHMVYVPAAAGSGASLYVSPWIDLDNGVLSAAAGNVLNLNLSAALTSGQVSVICCGTEE